MAWVTLLIVDTVALTKIDPRVKYHSYTMSGIILRIGHTRPNFNANGDRRIDDGAVAIIRQSDSPTNALFL